MQTVTRLARLVPSLFLSVLALGLWHGFLTLNSAQASHPNATVTLPLNRGAEPVTVRGVLSGIPVDQLFVYREVGGVWEQIPFQIDEVTASGSYTTTEDGLMDANDEVVFMAGDLGGVATTSITAALALPISSTWYTIKVTDPLSPTQNGWAYIVRSTMLTYSNSVDYVNYIAASRRISATSYASGWATTYLGLNYLSLYDSGNILDRTKLRVALRIGNVPLTWTEEDLPASSISLIKDGRVRVILRTETGTTLAYRSFLQTIVVLDTSIIPPNWTLQAIRVSTDLTNTITNGTFYNENTLPNGVTIDGITDTVPATPFVSDWRQISLDSGTMIQIMDLGSPGGIPFHYYKDNGSIDNADTGDKRSYGDSGTGVISPTATLITVTTAQYVLPGRQDNRGAEFYGIFQNPLLVTVQVGAAHQLYLPLILR